MFHQPVASEKNLKRRGGKKMRDTPNGSQSRDAPAAMTLRCQIGLFA